MTTPHPTDAALGALITRIDECWSESTAAAFHIIADRLRALEARGELVAVPTPQAAEAVAPPPAPAVAEVGAPPGFAGVYHSPVASISDTELLGDHSHQIALEWYQFAGSGPLVPYVRATESGRRDGTRIHALSTVVHALLNATEAELFAIGNRDVAACPSCGGRVFSKTLPPKCVQCGYVLAPTPAGETPPRIESPQLWHLPLDGGGCTVCGEAPCPRVGTLPATPVTPAPGVDVAAMHARVKAPPYNHTRDDGIGAPCPICKSMIEENHNAAGAWIAAGAIHTGEYERRQRAYELCAELGLADSLATWERLENAMEWAAKNSERDDIRERLARMTACAENLRMFRETERGNESYRADHDAAIRRLGEEPGKCSLENAVGRALARLDATERERDAAVARTDCDAADLGRLSARVEARDAECAKLRGEVDLWRGRAEVAKRGAVAL